MSEDTSTEKMLACEVPEGAQPGSTFHVISPDHKYYEVVVPESARPGDTINILLSEQSEFESASGSGAADASQSVSALLLTHLRALGAALQERAARLDSDYKISERVQEVDNKYEISARTRAFIVPVVAKAKQVHGDHYCSTITTTHASCNTSLIYSNSSIIQYCLLHQYS